MSQQHNHSQLSPNPLVNGPPGAKLDPTALITMGSGAALQQIPKRTSRVVRVEVNSIDRNYGKFPLSSEFQWTFPFPVKEVREVRLIGGTIPVPFYNIDDGWNQFTFQEGGIQYTVTIPPGAYTICKLMAELTTLLNALPGITNTYLVSLTPNTNKITFKATAGTRNFGLLFGTGNFVDTIDNRTKAILELHCPARYLGFGWADYYSNSGVITAARAPNMWYSLERSYLYLNFDTTQDLRSIFRGAGRKEPSALIYNDELNTYNFPNQEACSILMPLTKYLNKETFDTNIVPAPAALSRIAVLDISLRDEFFNLINTQGREMSLLLELVIVD